MPYIKQPRRDQVENVVGTMIDEDIQANGDLNYILFHYCRHRIKPSYNNYKNYIGELRQCATEIERRLLAPYEDQKIIENGDV